MTTPDDSITGDERSWEQGYEDHELQQLRRLAKLTPEQKLEWLEEAHRLVLQLETAKKAAGTTPPPTHPSGSAPR
jgi:hypothetical protein